MINTIGLANRIVCVFQKAIANSHRHSFCFATDFKGGPLALGLLLFAQNYGG